VTPASAPILRTEGLVKAFKKRTVVKRVALEVYPGETVGLLGKNGAGKTTTFSMVVGLLKPDRGRIYLEERDITRLPMFKRARAGIAYLPQEASAFRNLTVRQNIVAVLEYQPMSRKEREMRADALLADLRIDRLANNPAYTLSGGERRRTEIARALAIEPKIILLDEPFAGIDPIAVNELQETVAELCGKGIAVLITDHNVRETLHIADRAYIINEGEVFASGTPDEVANDPAVRKFYLGDRFRI